MAILQINRCSVDACLQHDLTCHAFTTTYYGSYHTGLDNYVEFSVASAIFKGIDFSYEDSPHWGAWQAWRKTLNL